MKNKQLAIRVLKKDCEITGSFYVKGETCAVGRLALEAGVSPRRLAKIPEVGVDAYNYHDETTMGLIKEILGKIKRKFGLTKRQLLRIQHQNDGVVGLESRRNAVVKLVKKL